MKKPVPYRDDRFDVGRQTQILNNIKKNDSAMEILNQMQHVIEEMTGFWRLYDKAPADLLIYKDAEGNEINQHEFWDSLYKFVSNNQDYLLRDSQREYKMLTILDRKSILS